MTNHNSTFGEPNGRVLNHGAPFAMEFGRKNKD